MRSKIALLGVVTVAAGAVGAPAMAAGDNGSRTVVAKAVQSPGTSLGAAKTSAKTSFIVTFKLRNESGAESFVKSVSDPTSASHGKYLTPKQFTSRYAASDKQVKKALKWLRAQGLKPGAVSSSRSYVPVTGSVSAINKAFGASMKSYKKSGRTFSAPSKSVTVPKSIGTIVSGVVGLDESRQLTTTNVKPNDVLPAGKKTASTLKALGATSSAASGASDACSSYYGQYHLPNIPAAKSPLKGVQAGAMCGYTPQQMRAARGITKVKNTGKGMKVGITLWCNDPRITADTNTWAKQVGFTKLKSGQLQILNPAGGYDSDYCDDEASGGVNGEQALDVQSIHGAAPDAGIVYSGASKPYDDALLTSLHVLVDGNKVDAITNSWGGSETDDAATNDAYSAVFMQAAAQGISVFYSSGDYGDNTNGNQKVTAPSADYPAANPWVTAVGGTSLATGNKSGSKVSWEQAWNTSRSVQSDDAWGKWTYRYGGGGGVSSYHEAPYYQSDISTRFTGVDPHRSYPDLAGAGDPYTGYLIGYHDETTSNFTLGKIGGTSWSSPWTAGTVVLTGKRVGFINPTIYGKGHAGLTDIKGNTLTHGFEQKGYFTTSTGTIYTALTTIGVNSQQVQDQTLTSEKGYDNLTGYGVPSSTKAFITALKK